MLCNQVQIYYFIETWCCHVFCATKIKTADSSERTVNINITSWKIVVFIVTTVRTSYLWLNTWKSVAYVQSHISVQQGYTNPRHLVSWVTKLYMVAPNVFGSSTWYLLHVTFLVPTIFRWLLHCWKICGHLLCSILNVFQDLLELGHWTFGLQVRCCFSDCRIWPVWYFYQSFFFYLLTEHI